MAKNPTRLSVGFLYDDTLDSNDGVAQYVKTLGSWLSTQGHSVSYLVGETKMREWDGGQVYSLARNQAVVFNGNRLSMPLPADSKKIKHILDSRHFDVLHVQVPYSPFMSKRVIDSISKQTAIVGTFHIYPSARWVSFGTRLLRILLGSSLKEFDKFISVSRPAATFASKSFGISSRVIPNLVDVERYTVKPGAGKDPKSSIVFLGRLVKRKGCMELLEAFTLLAKRKPDVHLTIAGDGPQRTALESFVSRHKLNGRVSFRGYIKEDEKPLLLASADIACFPALYGESFGIVLIEAMAAGAGVVVGGRNPGYESVLQQRQELLIEPHNSNEFAARLQQLLTDKQLAIQLHSWQRRAVKQYDVKTVGPRIVDIYYRSIASRHKRLHN